MKISMKPSRVDTAINLVTCRSQKAKRCGLISLLLLAWREIARLKNSANTNLLILDEVFDSSLDTVGTDEFLKLMSVLSASTNVFVISHKSDQLVDKFENQITFVKTGNFSKLTG